MHAGAALQLSDTPNNHQPYFRRVFNLLIGTNTLALQAASCRAQSLGYTATIVTSQMQGEAKELAAQIVDNARQFTGKLPACLLYGGESTVTVTGAGKGGRNMELALAAGILLSAHPTITILSAGTDGTDGPTDAAGAVVNSSVMQQAMQAGRRPQAYLSNNDAYHFFAGTAGLLLTGPTKTNVMDIVVVLINQLNY